LAGAPIGQMLSTKVSGWASRSVDGLSALGGKIDVKSKAGEGSLFSFELSLPVEAIWCASIRQSPATDDSRFGEAAGGVIGRRASGASQGQRSHLTATAGAAVDLQRVHGQRHEL
jgi:hypothetical protein